MLKETRNDVLGWVKHWKYITETFCQNKKVA